MRPFVCKRDGMWVVTSNEGQRRYLSLRWAMKHAALRCPQNARLGPVVGYLPNGKAYRSGPPTGGELHVWKGDGSAGWSWGRCEPTAGKPPFESRFTTGDMGDRLRRLGFTGGSPEDLNVGWESYGKPGGILDGSDPGWRVLDPGYPANRTAPAVMA